MAYENAGYLHDSQQIASVLSRRLRKPLSWGVSLVLFLGAMVGCLSRSLTGIQVSPAAGSVTVAAGQTAQFQAEAVYTESGHATTSQNVTSQTTWQSSSPAVATITSQGLATGVATGTATITANMKGQFGPVSATSNITVTAVTVVPTRVLTSLSVIPNSQTLATTGESSQFIAIGTYSGGSPLTQNLTDTVFWQSSDRQIAQVNAFGVVSSTGAGEATISALATASDGSVTSATGTITVTNAPLPRILSSLVVIPGTQPVTAIGETVQLIAIGTYNSGSPATQDVTNLALWQTSDPSVALVNASGLVTTIGIGQATVTALATSPNGSVTSASGVITAVTSSGTVVLPALTVEKVGTGTGTVTGTANGNVVVTCGSGTGCVGNFPLNQTVVLTAVADAGSQFDGWSIPCNPATATTCTIVMTNNESLIAIFDPKVLP